MSELRQAIIRVLSTTTLSGVKERELPFIVEDAVLAVPNYRLFPEHFKTLEDSKEILREMGMQGELSPAQYETTKRFIDLMSSFSVCPEPTATWEGESA